MKLKGVKIGAVTYFVSESQIAEHGTAEKAAEKAKEKQDMKKAPKVEAEEVKPKASKKAVVEKIESEDAPA